MSDSANLNLPYLEAAQAQKHVTHNDALDVLDALVHLSVKDRHRTGPAAEVSEGERYIVADGATGDWAGKATMIAVFQAGGWVFHTPKTGWLAWLEAERLLMIWTGGRWADLCAALAGVNNLAGLGIATEADDENPLAAKLNKALFAARSVAEGGSGDLRYTLNKETPDNVLSMLLQSGWGGRAEFGLIGCDDFMLRVSGDGTTWRDALRVDRNSGALSILNGFSGMQSFVRQFVSVSEGLAAIDYKAGHHVELQLNGDVRELSIANWPANGGQVILLIKQDGEGARRVAWPGNWLAPCGDMPSVSTRAFAIDRFVLTYDGSNVYIDTLGRDYR
ncbi:MAG: DUF2793 domain-containing protein [Hyphomicrobiales bacterium]